MMKGLVATGSAWLVSLALAGSASALTFSPPTFVPAGTQPHSVTTADFDGDGNADIASANIYSDNVSIHLGDGAGDFLPASFFGVGANPEVIVTDDFNGDGFPDLATANITSNNVSVLLGDGTGSFGPATNFGVDTGPHSLVTADFDGDGDQDIATVSVYNDTVSVLLGDGSGGFGSPGTFPIQPGAFSPSITSADFNNDGNADLATSNFHGDKLSVLFGDGSGGFGPSTDLAINPVIGPIAIASGDLNADGNQDLISANYTYGSLSVLLGDGAGNFAPQIDYGTGPATNPDLVLVVDMNGDGDLDLVAPIYNQDSLVVLFGDGTGAFGPPNTFSVGASTYPVSVISADFNSDDLPDLATANFLPNFLSVLLNTSGPPPVADVRITKTATPSNPRPGDVVTYTLKAKNIGNAPAHDVVVTDSLPVGLTFVSADPPCTEAMGTVTCPTGSLAPGQEETYEVKATVDAWGNANPAADHLLDVQKVEVQLDLEAGVKKTIQANCPSGYIVSDGSVRTDHIDQDAGDWPTVKVLESRAKTAGIWKITVKNTATGRAQVKVFAVCIRQSTVDGTHTHNLIESGGIEQSESMAAGTHETVLECGPGQVAIQPGSNLGEDSDLVYSQPEGNGWKFIVFNHVPADGDFSISCMTRQVSLSGGHTHDLKLERIFHEFEVGPGKVNEAQLTCADGSKGIVAGWDLDHGLLSLGNDPRPVTRAFKLYNPTNAPLHARLSLLCLGDRTGGEHLGPEDLVNTAYISTSSNEIVTGNNMSSVTVTAEDTDNFTPVPDPPPAKPTPNNPVGTTRLAGGVFLKKGSLSATITCSVACSGKAKLFSLKALKIKGHRYRKGTLLALAHYRLTAPGTRRIWLRIRGDRGRRLLQRSRAGLVRTSGGASRKVRIHH